MYRSTKTYGHELGFSCCFRQHRAKSHCNLLHGYSLAFKFVFEAETLDEHNWVQDFGGLKPLKLALGDMFDHTCVVSKDDPAIAHFGVMARAKLIDLRTVEAVGCEAFAKLAFDLAESLIAGLHEVSGHRVLVVSCECAEHGANSAVYLGER